MLLNHKEVTMQQPALSESLLSRFIEDTPTDLIGGDGTWNWKPAGSVYALALNESSPTTEYSTENGED